MMDHRPDSADAGDAPAAPVLPAAGACEKVLVSSVKNEAPFLLEWIAYHKVIGFTRIVIFSNASDDGTEEILSALAAAHEIEHRSVVPRLDQSPQSAAVSVFERDFGYRDGDWYQWLDADEFLVIHVGSGRLDDLVSAIGDRAGINVNWRLFGTSGHERFPGRFVSQEFWGASGERLGANRETKTLFRKSPDILGFGRNGIYRPRLAKGHGLAADSFLAGNGRPMAADSQVTRKWLAGDKAVRTNIVNSAEMGWALAQINHYSVRTPEFFKLKRLRGRGAGKLRLGENHRHTDEYFKRFNLNGRKDASLWAWEAAVSEEMQRLRGIGAVDVAVRKAHQMIEKAVAQLRDDDQAAPTANDDAEVAVADPPAEGGFELWFSDRVKDYVRETYAGANVILEYGSGGSTVLAAELGKTVFSVESDRAWAERLANTLRPISNLARVHHVDLGPTGSWGRPTDESQARRFHAYALSVWDRPDFEEPDLVLIDGRFRAACLVAVLLRAKRPTTVIFDDYRKRRYYHGVEKLARKEEMVGRMARFTVTPGPIPPEMLTQAIGWFTDPR